MQTVYKVAICPKQIYFTKDLQSLKKGVMGIEIPTLQVILPYKRFLVFYLIPARTGPRVIATMSQLFQYLQPWHAKS